MSEDASDVTKALAAFGAPSLRYHSFGQSQLRSAATLPRRPVALSLPAATMQSPVLVAQAEPIAAPEEYYVEPAAPKLTAIPPALLRETAPEPLFPINPTVAPPPRPLAEWAAPVSSMPPPPVVAPVPTPVPAPTLPPLQPRAPVASSMPQTPPVLTVVESPPAVAVLPPPLVAPAYSAAHAASPPTKLSSLPEIFEFLAAS